MLPAFVTEKDGKFAEALFTNPDTACNEQNLNSVIVKPAHGEKIALTDARKGKTYRIEGYAYDGGGHQVQRVEVSLDDGETWLYCIRKFPDAPIRHGNKFWTWLHWHVDIEITHLLDCIPIGEEVEIRSPTGEIVYNGKGKFSISDKEYTFKRINLNLGGSGITPGYSLIAHAMLFEGDGMEIRVVDANKTEQDILLKEDLDKFERESGGGPKIRHVLSHAGEGWKGTKGHVDAEMFKESLFEPGEGVGVGVFLCGPLGII